MRPSFNTAGPCIPGEHYMLPPGDRLGRVMQLIEEEKYFTLHAGRQTGKTTSLQWLVKHLHREGRLHAIWVDLETVMGATASSSPSDGWALVARMRSRTARA